MAYNPYLQNLLYGNMATGLGGLGGLANMANVNQPVSQPSTWGAGTIEPSATIQPWPAVGGSQAGVSQRGYPGTASWGSFRGTFPQAWNPSTGNENAPWVPGDTRIAPNVGVPIKAGDMPTPSGDMPTPSWQGGYPGVSSWTAPRTSTPTALADRVSPTVGGRMNATSATPRTPGTGTPRTPRTPVTGTPRTPVTRPTTNTAPLNIPTPQEAYNWATNLPYFQQMQGILGNMATPESFRQSIDPYLQQAYNAIGRSGIPSSSYADRVLGNLIGSQWAQNQNQQLTGWQNTANQMMPYFTGYQLPYWQMANMLTG